MTPPARQATATGPLPARSRVAVVGSGFSGIGTAAYPGAACDVPRHLHSFAAAPKPDWSHVYARQPEIRGYLEQVAADAGVLPQLWCDTDVLAGRWDDVALVWRLETSRGPLTAEVLVSGCGGLVEPHLPEVPGTADFTGPSFHSARWGGRLPAHAAVGHRARRPRLHPARAAPVPVAARPAAALPHRPVLEPGGPAAGAHRRGVAARPDREAGAADPRAAGRRPGAAGTAHPGLRHRLQAGHRQRRLPARADPARRRTGRLPGRRGPRALGGRRRRHRARGRRARLRHRVPGDGPAAGAPAHRPGGRTLSEQWAEGGAQAHRGTTVAGFPNLFLLLGPNTVLGHTSVVLMIEAQIGYVLAALAAMEQAGAGALEVRRPAQDAYNAQLQAALTDTVWNAGGCRSWYRDEHGRNFTLWPTHALPFLRQMRRFDAVSYELRTARRDAVVRAR